MENTPESPDKGAPETKIVVESHKREVSATTIARMMGVATSSELEVLESKIDVVASKINAITVKVEKMQAVLNRAPSGSDLERIDVNIGSLRSLIREAMAGVQSHSHEDSGSSSEEFQPRIMTNKVPSAPTDPENDTEE